MLKKKIYMYAITIFNRISVSDMCKIIIGVCFVKSFKQQIHPLKNVWF